MEQAVFILRLLVEGVSVRSIERLTDVHRDTILRLLVLAGEQCGRVLEERIHQVPVKDVQAEHDRLADKGVKFTKPVTSTTGAIIAVLDDSCGNLIQLTQLTWG